VGVGDDELHAGEPARGEGAEEAEPEGAILAGPAVAAEDLALPLAVDRRGDNDGDVDDAAALAHALGERIEPDVRVGAVRERPLAEGLHLLVERPADARDLALRDAGALGYSRSSSLTRLRRPVSAPPTIALGPVPAQ